MSIPTCLKIENIEITKYSFSKRFPDSQYSNKIENNKTVQMKILTTSGLRSNLQLRWINIHHIRIINRYKTSEHCIGLVYIPSILSAQPTTQSILKLFYVLENKNLERMKVM